MERVFGAQEGAELSPSFGGLSPSFWCKFDSMVRRTLMDFSIFCFRFGVSDAVGKEDRDGRKRVVVGVSQGLPTVSF